MGVGGSGPLPPSGNSELDRLRRTVSTYFPVYEARLGPQSVLFAVHADHAALSEKFDRMRQELWAQGYVPVLRQVSGEEFVEVLRRPKVRRNRLWINGLLIAGTLATTSFAGALIWLTYVGGTNLGLADFLNGGLYFALPVMTILGLHEFAHYLMARRRHLDASLPYFIPVPPPFLFGTLGAFVSMREPFPDKKALFDIGAAGPLAGFAVSIPITLAGLYLSAHAPVLPLSYCGPTVLGTSYGSLVIGSSLFWTFLSYFVPSSLISLHPLALAGWVGIFVTAINLLPAGQLDGGHIFRALFGDRTRYVSYGVVILLFGLGIFYTGWWFFAILVLLTGLRHPPPLNDLSPLGTRRYVVGAVVLAILISGFVIVPLSAPPGSLNLNGASSAVPATPPPGAAVAANLSVTVVNGDPVPHGYVFSTSITNVSVAGPNGTTLYLTGSALASWAANSTWRFLLPDGHSINETGASFALPTADYVTINATASHNSYSLRIAFSNTEAAREAVISLNANQLCATAGTG
ncbi:MAG: site-2 protease family protein, partial [Thermoplasmata archaeon]